MTQINVTIMGQPYSLSCREEEETRLREAVAYLDGKMSALRDSHRVRGTDRIAVMAALSIAAEYLSTKSSAGIQPSATLAQIKEKIESMNETLDKALEPQGDLF